MSVWQKCLGQRHAAAWLWVASVCVMALLLSCALACTPERTRHDQLGGTAPRVVSLSPGITESMLVLGAAPQLIGVSDYCLLPSDLKPPRVGSALTPNYEAIARLKPDLIVATDVAGTQLLPLNKLAKTVSLPWLELDQVTSSLHKLGELLGQPQQGQALAARMSQALSVAVPESAPRVLWILDLGDSGSNETWFVRDNSLHGAVLRAAGARNAVDHPVEGLPKLSAEELLVINPSVILTILARPHLSAEAIRRETQRIELHFKRFAPLTAVKQQRLLVLHHPGAMNLGPSVLDLIPLIKSALADALPSLPSHGKRP